MILKSHSLLHLLPIVFLASGLAIGQQAVDGKGKAALRIEVQDQQGVRIGSPEATSTSQSNTVSLDINRAYQSGDRILFTGPKEMALRVDHSMQECMIFAPNPISLAYELPHGRAEHETGSAYAPESFSGDSHQVTLRALTEQERHGYRNLALNPCDQLKSEPAIFPHATSSSVARNLYDFAARNAIDGISRNGHHGVWPYQSWGPELVPDAWWMVDFGRLVTVDKVRLMLRADLPHDSYWKHADVEFSDGSRMTIQLAATADFQEFTFPHQKTAWLRLTHLVSDDPSKWCALIELEAWGRE